MYEHIEGLGTEISGHIVNGTAQKHGRRRVGPRIGGLHDAYERLVRRADPQTVNTLLERICSRYDGRAEPVPSPSFLAHHVYLFDLKHAPRAALEVSDMEQRPEPDSIVLHVLYPTIADGLPQGRVRVFGTPGTWRPYIQERLSPIEQTLRQAAKQCRQ